MKRVVTQWVTMAAALAIFAPCALARETRQDWYGRPVLPAPFDAQDPPEDYRLPVPRSGPPPVAESEFPKLLSVVDLDAWRRQDDVRSLRELAGDAFFGIPLLIPQILIEEFLPLGIPIGPTSFLYRDGKDSRKLPMVVFDQAVFHEEQFLAQAQANGDDAYNDSLTRSQRHVLRRALTTGFRATYALPSASTDLIVETSDELGGWAYVVAPTAVGALLFLKGLDQKVSIEDTIKVRFQVMSGRDWLRAPHDGTGTPALNCEVRIADLPVALILCVEMSDRGMQSQFVGLGTSLDVVHDLLSREENRGLRPGD